MSTDNIITIAEMRSCFQTLGTTSGSPTHFTTSPREPLNMLCRLFGFGSFVRVSGGDTCSYNSWVNKFPASCCQAGVIDWDQGAHNANVRCYGGYYGAIECGPDSPPPPPSSPPAPPPPTPVVQCSNQWQTPGRL